MSTKPQTSASSNTGHRSHQSESARQAKRTWAFVIVTIGCLLITGLFEWISRPATIEEYGKVGQEFYPDFTDPTTATSLTVSVIDPEEVKPLEFSVKQADNGQWVIPSHHNYPADAADQLAQTASSVIGIKRGAMVTRWASDHARYGVVDPQTDTVGIDELEGIGKRITLGGKDNSILASYIVGKKVEGEGNRYYVRHPSEDETYIADLDINLTTRFRDWVNTDLLDIASTDVLRVELNDYSFDEIKGTVTGNIQSVLSRATSGDDWKLFGMDDATQEVNADAIRETLDTLSNLEIAGVRPKQPGLTADLRIDRNALKSQMDADRLTNDLLARGFLLQPNPEDKNLLELIAREGEMFVGTDDGLLYRLYFGRVFTGSEQELEIGLNADDGEAQAQPESKPADEKSEAGDADEGDTEKDKPEASGKPGRYVFVRVNFDPTLLGEALTEPTEPQESDELKALAEKVKQAEANGETTPSDASKEETNAEAGNAENPEAETEESDSQKLKRLQDEFAAAKAQYRDQVVAYGEYQQKLNDGEKKSEELNRRFALWYYVIPGESYDKLSLNREDLTKAKEADGAEAGGQANNNALPSIGGLSDALMNETTPLQAPGNADPASPDTASGENVPADQPPATEAPATEAPATEAPATEAPATEAPKDASDDTGNGDEPKAESSPPAEETPPATEPASEPPASEPPAVDPPADEPTSDGAAEPDAPAEGEPEAESP